MYTTDKWLVELYLKYVASGDFNVFADFINGCNNSDYSPAEVMKKANKLIDERQAEAERYLK